MIEDVRDLSLAEKEKQITLRNLKKYILQCIIPIILSTGIVTVFSMFIVNDFLLCFTKENAAATTGRFLSVLCLYITFFIAIYKYSKGTKKVARDFIIFCIVLDISYIASLSCSILFNVYALPIIFISTVLATILDSRYSVLGAIAAAALLIVDIVFSLDTLPFKDDFIKFDEMACSIAVNITLCFMINLFERKHFSRLKFLINSLLIPLIAVPFVCFLTMISGELSLKILYNAICFYLANFAAVLLYMPVVAMLEGMFNIADDFRLSELCSLSNPILKRLASEAPGTFNHSLVVGTLAEACASAIGENPHMARCAAYYHDIGKLKAPIYFSENQSSYNPHDELIPEVSVSMITSHTIFGEILAKQNKLPEEIIAVCRQHHGTAPVSYFYRKALTLKEEGELAVEKYTYSGPKPQTKIAAIIMIADTIEAALRAYMPDTREEYEARINKLVDEKVELRQFDECPITLGDIAIIKQTTIDVLPSIHHSRINYDKKSKK